MRHFAVTTAMVLGLSAQGVALAGASTGAFAVSISLQGNAGICTSQTLSQATGALVRVACATGQFVNIEVDPAKPFLGVHGGAYRFNFGPGLAWPQGEYGGISPSLDAGTCTALRILNASGGPDPIELLISF